MRCHGDPAGPRRGSARPPHPLRLAGAAEPASLPPAPQRQWSLPFPRPLLSPLRPPLRRVPALSPGPRRQRRPGAAFPPHSTTQRFAPDGLCPRFILSRPPPPPRHGLFRPAQLRLRPPQTTPLPVTSRAFPLRIGPPATPFPKRPMAALSLPGSKMAPPGAAGGRR